MPTIKLVIHLSGILCGQDFITLGRGIEGLDLGGFIEENLLSIETPLLREIILENLSKSTKIEVM
jgi:hypothetical protein